MSRSTDVRTVTPVETLPGRVVDVVVWGASRPDLFRRTVESFRAHAKAESVRLRWFLEEGAFDAARGAEEAAAAQEYGFDGIHVEALGSYGWAMTNAMNRWVRAPYMFSLEDDWLCIRDLDLDLAVDVMEQHQGVNQLRFNFRKNAAEPNPGLWVKEYPFFVQPTVPRLPQEALGVDVVAINSYHWHFNPGLWRMDFIRPRWQGARVNVHHHMNSTKALIPTESRPSADWYALTLGALTWGPVKEPPFFEHLGRERSIHKTVGL